MKSRVASIPMLIAFGFSEYVIGHCIGAKEFDAWSWQQVLFSFIPGAILATAFTRRFNP